MNNYIPYKLLKKTLKVWFWLLLTWEAKLPFKKTLWNFNMLCVFSVTKLCPIYWNPMDCSLPGSVHGISQARILEWVAISSSRGSSRPRDQTCVSWVSCIGRWVRYHLSHLGSPVQLQWLILSFHFSSDCKGSSWALLKGQWTSHWPDWISLQALTWNGFWDMGWNKLRPPLQILVFNFVKGKAGQC